jgi:hypothetical protein
MAAVQQQQLQREEEEEDARLEEEARLAAEHLAMVLAHDDAPLLARLIPEEEEPEPDLASLDADFDASEAAAAHSDADAEFMKRSTDFLNDADSLLSESAKFLADDDRPVGVLSAELKEATGGTEPPLILRQNSDYERTMALAREAEASAHLGEDAAETFEGAMGTEDLHWDLTLMATTDVALNLRVNVPAWASVGWTFTTGYSIMFGYRFVSGDDVFQLNTLKPDNMESTSRPNRTQLLLQADSAQATFYKWSVFGANHVRKYEVTESEFDLNKNRFPPKTKEGDMKGYYLKNRGDEEETWIDAPRSTRPDFTYCWSDTYWYMYTSEARDCPAEPVHCLFENASSATGVLVLTFDNTAAAGLFATDCPVQLTLRSDRPLSWQHYGQRQTARSTVNGGALVAIAGPALIAGAVAGPAVAGMMAARGAAGAVSIDMCCVWGSAWV